MSETKVLTNDLLKEKMTDAVVARGVVLDFNTATQPGTYHTSAGCLNFPPKVPYHGILTVEQAANAMIKQEFVSLRSVNNSSLGVLCTRICWDGDWKPWMYLPLED